MATIRELYTDAIVYENSFLAYGIFLLAKRDLIDWEADRDTLNLDSLTFEEINEAIKQNLLSLNKVNLYVMKTSANIYSFVFANDVKSATSEYTRIKKNKPVFVIEANSKMDHEMFDEETKKTFSFREVRNQTKSFPHYVCEYEKT